MNWKQHCLQFLPKTQTAEKRHLDNSTTSTMKKILLFPFAFLLMLLPYKSIGTIITIPTQYSTIQEGINASFPGDTVLVAPGTYYENINLYGKNVVLASEFVLNGNSSFISSTIIDGNNSGRVITLENGEDMTCEIIGFTIQHGYSIMSGGIYIYDSSPKIRNCIIQDNIAASHGGGVCITGTFQVPV